MDIQKYQKKNEDFIAKIDDKFKNHDNLVRMILPNKIDIDTIAVINKDMEIN